MNPSANGNAGQQPPDPGQMPQIPNGGSDVGAAAGLPVPGLDSAAQFPVLPQSVPGSTAPAMTLPLPPVPAPGMPAAPNIPATPQNSRDPAQNDVSDTTPLANPQVIDDGDLIEKEWVHKAKQIVDRNRNDPYKQSEELTVFRADYMKKRYNKNIKLDE